MTGTAATQSAPTRKAGPGQAWVLILAMFLPILAIIGLAPALATLMDHFMDVPNAQVRVPILLTAPALCIAVFGSAAGWLTDRFGRRNLMLGAMLLYGVSGVAPFLFGGYNAVLATRLLLGVAEAFIMTIGNALLADYYSTDEQRKWLTVQGIVGPILGTVLLAGSGQLAAMGWQWPFALYALAFPILFFGYFNLWEPPRKAKQDAAAATTPFPWTTVGIACAITLVTSIIYFVQPIHMSLVLRQIGVQDPALIGLVSSVASIAVPFGALVFRGNAKRPIEYQLALAFLFMGVGLVGISLSRDYRLTAAAAWFQQLSAGMTIPILVAWCLGLFPAEHRGRGMGMWASALFVGQFLCPLAISGLKSLAGGLLPAITIVGGICFAAIVACIVSGARKSASLKLRVAA